MQQNPEKSSKATEYYPLEWIFSRWDSVRCRHSMLNIRVELANIFSVHRKPSGERENFPRWSCYTCSVMCLISVFTLIPNIIPVRRSAFNSTHAHRVLTTHWPKQVQCISEPLNCTRFVWSTIHVVPPSFQPSFFFRRFLFQCIWLIGLSDQQTAFFLPYSWKCIRSALAHINITRTHTHTDKKRRARTFYRDSVEPQRV